MIKKINNESRSQAKYRWLGGILIAVVLFAAGFTAGKMYMVAQIKKVTGPMFVFENGCLNLEKSGLAFPVAIYYAGLADTNNDGCLTKAEMREGRKNLKHDCPVRRMIELSML
jgi:hypothetical protein